MCLLLSVVLGALVGDMTCAIILIMSGLVIMRTEMAKYSYNTISTGQVIQ